MSQLNSDSPKSVKAKRGKRALPIAADDMANGVEDIQLVQSHLTTGPAVHVDRQQLIEEAAYHRAEARGFAPGQELEDWLAAESEVDARISGEGRAY